LHPETKPVIERGGPGRGKKTSEIISLVFPSFADDTAQKTGRSRRSIEQEIQIAKSLDEETKAAIKGTPLEDKKVDLLELSRVSEPEKRLELVDKVKSGEAKTIREAKGKQTETRKHDQRECSPSHTAFTGPDPSKWWVCPTEG